MVSLGVLSLLVAFAAADAGRVGEDGTGAMWVAPELLDAIDGATRLGCTGNALVQATELPLQGKVSFEWHPATGELTFAAAGPMPAAISSTTPPENFEPAPSTLAMRSCGSR
jgi:hypothetical protein